MFILYLLFRQGRCIFHSLAIWLRTTPTATTPVQPTIPVTDPSSVWGLQYISYGDFRICHLFDLIVIVIDDRVTKPKQAYCSLPNRKPNETNPNQTKPNQTKPDLKRSSALMIIIIFCYVIWNMQIHEPLSFILSQLIWYWSFSRSLEFFQISKSQSLWKMIEIFNAVPNVLFNWKRIILTGIP